MADGNLTDEQLKEFDAYLNGTTPQPKVDNDAAAEPAKPADLPRPSAPVANMDYLDEIINLHSKKADAVIGLLDKIDAKAHKDIVADLVDEMQYQKAVIKREKEQLGSLKQLFAQAKAAAKQ